MYGDTSVIRALARGMDDQAAEIREEADALVRAAEQVLWQGLAAQAMRLRTRSRAADLRVTADKHEEAAASLRRHADEVDRLKALIASIADRFQDMAEGARNRLASWADRAVDAVGRAADAVGRAPDALDEALARFQPPPNGHLDWLGVPDSFQALAR